MISISLSASSKKTLSCNIQQGYYLFLIPLFKPFNPLSPKSDQNQFSPNYIHTLSRAKSMRINKMIRKRKIFDIL